MSEIRYTKDHEWVRVEDGTGTVGITQHAQEQLGDIVFVELPEAGQELKQGDEIGTLESVKAASEVYAPASGTVQAVNEDLADDPAQLNSDPFGAGWLYTFAISDRGEIDGLMDEAQYKEFCAEG
ncbi:glycine cleavage system H protein [Limimonas halophila]|uniref:Glycine cleavage system H protein n=1 Tax=Limimonas halophila TaxID=1082479 RepID=A0A1G7PSP0_9PROT|nr:glycine cleavage system protein GcvH [Limimonas halophila]SDF89258.1 glycine cleavage system H protein [Limimonas halophila]